MSQIISGGDFDVFIGPYMVIFDKITLNIEDNSKPVYSKGLPNGYVRGKLAASGEVELDTKNFMLLNEAARIAGGWSKLGTWPAVFNAVCSDALLNVIAHDCLFKISKLIDASSEGGEKSMHTLPFDVTGSDFVTINGVPYQDSEKFLGLF